jgi:hypothetical protein
MSFASENITIETENTNFFMNFVTDTLLLLDPDLKMLLKDDIENIIIRSKFELQPNSWRPKPNPKNRLSTVYSYITNNELKDTFADLVQPVVEIACTPSKYDPLNVLSSKCVKGMLTYSADSSLKCNFCK